MSKKERHIEILAPAGSKESMIAAVGAGADAVYIGGSRFGARAYADNLDTEAMLEAIDYVHLHGKKLYLTVNTLLKQEEMGEPLYRYLKPYYEEGLDAVIVQDAGVLEFVNREFPGLAIHASTQMTLTMAEGAMNFRDYGVTRLVNARELSLEEIARIRKTTDLEIESFVHGALCYCYSGQCLMSSMIGGRSGNRGRCAQPCRMEYERKDAERESSRERFLLSPKDMCTLDMVAQLIEAGIDSFKIEGRMKRYEYSAGVAGAYRRETDRYFEMGPERYAAFHREHPNILRDEITALKDLYNRGGFSNGYYLAHNGREMMSMERPNHSGVPAGEVIAVKKNRAVLFTQEELHAQDILEIRMSNGGNYEFTLKEGCQAGEKLEANFTPGLPVCKGNKVFRTKNKELLQRISRECYEQEAGIPVKGYFTAIPGRPMALSAAAQGSEVMIEGEVVQRAMKQPVTQEKLRNQLEKTGDTPFYFTDLEIRSEGEIFIPLSKLNELRRNALDQLAEKIVKARQRSSFLEQRQSKQEEMQRDCSLESTRESGRADYMPFTKEQSKAEQTEPEQETGKQEKTNHEKIEQGRQNEVSASVMTREQLDAVLQSCVVTRIYYDLTALPLEEADDWALRAKQAGKKFLLRLPQICRADTYDWLKASKERMVSEQIDGYLIRNYEELYLITELWKKETAGKEKIADAMLYVMNREAKRFFYGLGLTGFTAPYEENQRELKELGLEDMELTVYGRIPLMTSAQCIRKNTAGCIKEGGGNPDRAVVLIDRKKKELPVKNFCSFCYNTIYNPECLSLLDTMEEIRLMAPRALRFDFTFESRQETVDILDNNREQPGISYTRGHFRRGVM